MGWDPHAGEPDYSEVIAQLSAGSMAAAPDETGRKRVLVVDGDVTSRLYLRAKLALQGGVDMYEASSGQEAVTMSQSMAFDGVLLELDLVDLDGFAACRSIKRHGSQMGHKPPKMVIFTGRNGLLVRLRAKLAGADAFISKPAHPGQLTQLLASF